MFQEKLIKPKDFQKEKKDFYEWYNNNLKKVKNKTTLTKKSLNKIDQDEYDINFNSINSVNSKNFFSIMAIESKNTFSREVKSGWCQPIIKEKYNPSGLIVMFRKVENDVPYYLVNSKFEPGNINIVHVSPTIQVTYSNIKYNYSKNNNYYLSYFLKYSKKNNLIDTLVSEDGGRFYKKQNRNVIMNIKNLKIKCINSSYKWISFYLLKYINSRSKIINPHIRSVISII